MAASTVFFRNEQDLPRLVEPSGQQDARLAERSRGPAQFFRMDSSPHDPAWREPVPLPAGEIALQAGRPGIYLHGSFFDLPDQHVSRPPVLEPSDPTDPRDPGKPREIVLAFMTPTVNPGGQSLATREGIFFNPETGRNEQAVVGGWIVELVLQSLRTTYYKPTHRDTPRQGRPGTVGEHEDAHKGFAREWWVLSNLQAIQKRDDIALFWVAWNGAPYPDDTQVYVISNYFGRLHAWEQRRELDLRREPQPTFQGIRATAPSHL
jgi:hypothetical protein